MTLEQFTQAVKSDDLWMEMIRSVARGKSLPDAITKVYGQAVSDGSLMIKPIGEHRKHIFNVLGTQAFSKTTGVQLQQEPVAKEVTEVAPVSSVPYEVHQKRIKELLESIKAIPDIKRVPKLTSEQIKAEGDWRPKEQTYKQNKTNVFIHLMKIEYGKLFSNPVSYKGGVLPGSPTFEDWLEDEITKRNLDLSALKSE